MGLPIGIDFSLLPINSATAAALALKADANNGTITGTVSLGGATSANKSLQVEAVTSAVNYLRLFGAPTGGSVAVASGGTDANIPIIISAKGTGWVEFRTNTFTQFLIIDRPSATKYGTITGGDGSNNVTIGTSSGDLTISSALVLSQSTLLKTSVALTNGAAAASGTLTNAPAAGNPTKWIPINDNGTTRYIPAW